VNPCGVYTKIEALLDHITNYLRFISNTQSFWFLLNTSFQLIPFEPVSSSPAWASYSRFGFTTNPTDKLLKRNPVLDDKADDDNN